MHLRFDALEIFRHERAIDHEVVEEALVDRRSDAALRAGKERCDGSRHQMRRRVPRDLERFGRLVGDDLHLRVGGQRIREIDETIVDFRGERRVGEAR